MDIKSYIKGLEKEAEMEEAALNAKKKMIEDLKTKLGVFDPIPKVLGKEKKNTAPIFTEDNNEIIDLDSLIPETHKKPSFIDDVRDVIKRFGAQEFTVQHVDMVLKDRFGLSPDDGSQRAKVSQALSKLKETGFIEMKHKGVGSAPNRYAIKQQVKDDLI